MWTWEPASACRADGRLIQVSVHVALFLRKKILFSSLCLFACWLKSSLVFVAGRERMKMVDLMAQGDHCQVLAELRDLAFQSCEQLFYRADQRSRQVCSASVIWALSSESTFSRSSFWWKEPASKEIGGFWKACLIFCQD
jgi:hypothetical protein